MAIYCELPGERLCDIGWERLFCTKQWLEDQIREIRGYSREQRIRLGREYMYDVVKCLVESYKDEKSAAEVYERLFLFAFGIASLNRSSPTQSWKEEVAEMFCGAPEDLDDKTEPFEDRKRFSYKTVVACIAMFGASASRPAGSRYLQLCICTACADTPNEAAFDWIRRIHQEYLVLLERWDYALRASALGKDKSEKSVTDDYQNGKTILPLREYRRQQRAAERKKGRQKQNGNGGKQKRIYRKYISVQKKSNGRSKTRRRNTVLWWRNGKSNAQKCGRSRSVLLPSR